jgi:LuxR family transcriptional regulator, maltose regulon positive regulatory protein
VTAAASSAGRASVARTTVPATRPDDVWRDELIQLLEGSKEFPFVSVAAPAGYGKTTALAQWASHDPRRFAWLTVDERDGEPIRFLRSLSASLKQGGIDGLSPARRSSAANATTWLTLMPTLSQALAEQRESFVIVLDDTQHIDSTETLELVAMLTTFLPEGSQLVLSGRTRLHSLFARERASKHVFDIGPTELALIASEAEALVMNDNAEIGKDVAKAVVSSAEGWPAGIYLAALDPPEPQSASNDNGGRFVDEYLRIEHLSQLSRKERAFLMRSAVLDPVNADICDAVLERHDSLRMLESVEASHLFLVPLDHERTWYRFHPFFRSALRRELDRVEPTAARELQQRAADWCEAHRLLEDAMRYAIASDDVDRMARLLVVLALPVFRAGRMATLEGWLERFDDGALIRRHPGVALVGALAHALSGHGFQAERWLDAAAAADDDVGPLLDGSTTARPWVAVGEAMLCRHGPERMRADAELALAELGPLSPWRAPAMWLLANAALLQKDPSVDKWLEDALDAGEQSGATFAATSAAAQRAILALGRDDLAAAQALVARAYATVDGDDFPNYAAMAPVFVAEARTELRAGNEASAQRALTKAQRLRPQLSYAVPFLAVYTLLEMARAYNLLGDVKGAKAVLVDASEVLRHRPDLGVLGAEVETLRGRLMTADRQTSGWETSLTTAELRLLPLLATHLTFEAIGERLFVSRNTVKTHAISIYRKLGVSSRGEAVSRARELALVSPGSTRIAKIVRSE